MRLARAGLIDSRLTKEMLEMADFPCGLAAPRFVHRSEEFGEEAAACFLGCAQERWPAHVGQSFHVALLNLFEDAR